MILDEEDYLAHYGILRKSGRYPWGSGGTQSQRNRSYLDTINELKSKGMSETEIARAFDTSTTALRAARTIALNEQKQAQIAMAQRLKDKGLSNGAIATRMGLPGESSVRALLAPGAKDRADILLSTSNMLKEQVAKKKFIDIGGGVEHQIGVSSTKLSAAIAVLREEGYEVHSVAIQQVGTGKNTTVKVLAPPGTTWGEVMKGRSEIKQITDFSDDGGRSYINPNAYEPVSISPKRVAVKYAEDGGAHADGVIYVREGVPDVSLGAARYAQVRVKVGNDHYLKGMAMYKDDLPDGVDLMFNTNKSKKDMPTDLDAMKEIDRKDPDLPFGAVVRPLIEYDVSGKRVVKSSMNIVNEEGDWTGWSKTLSTQMLSKQSPKLAKEQLDLTFERRRKEFEELKALTNPTVRRTLLEKFGDNTDSAAVHLDAAGFNRQSWHVILPVSSLKPTEVYAPRFQDGERVVLIRFPHAGTFEIPELTVNNKHRESKKLIGDAPDAIGIHHKVAERLSGADFDGDTVLVIPNNSGKIKTTPALERLRDFDPRSEYKEYPGMKRMTAKQKGLEMGGVSNLITDMTLRGASADKIVRAVRHSMVVIDAEKHKLDWRRSAQDHGIAALKEEFQGRKNAGASTLISRATRTVRVEERKARPAAEGGPIDRETGKRVYVPTGNLSYRTGKPKLDKSTELAETDDAFTLVSGNGGTRMERLYADHSNKLKALANEARRESVNTPPAKYSPSAKKTYAAEVTALNSKLALANRNRPLERQAQIVANTIIRTKFEANPNMDDASRKKIKNQALNDARHRTGADKQQIKITDREWEAIQAGAISDSKLRDILDNTDVDNIRALATPKTPKMITSTEQQRARSMMALGYTRAEIASQLGVSVSTLDTSLAEE